jgi:hypothetical protein
LNNRRISRMIFEEKDIKLKDGTFVNEYMMVRRM